MNKLLTISLRLLLLALVLFAAFVCLNAAEPITVRVNSVAEAWQAAAKLRGSCPWPSAYTRSVQGTQSMWPTLDEGCILVMGDKPFAAVEDGRKGDICSAHRFDKDGKPIPGVLHRAVSHYGSGPARTLILSGDNNRHSDGGSWGDKEVQGVVYAIIRFKDVPWSPSMSLAAWEAKVKATSTSTAASK